MQVAANPLTPEARELETALFEIKRVIVGQDRAIERLLVCLLAQGHCLLEGVPGLAKTLAMETMARVAGGSFARIQFTPDLLPADIVGTRIYRASSESFDVELGPVFANFVLADEINRAPAKVQSALLEVMAEHQVSIGGRTFSVPEPFLVLATQNPVEQEGVYPLPEAQRDRFLMKVHVGYPSPLEEVEIVNRMGTSPPRPRPALDPAAVRRLQAATKAVYVDRGVVDYAVSLVLATRSPADMGMPELVELIEYGASPRASLGLVAAGRALALLRGRRYVLPQDVFDVAPEIFRHRLVLSYEAIAQGLHVDQIVARVLSTVPAPRVAPSQDPTAAPFSAPHPTRPTEPSGDGVWAPSPGDFAPVPSPLAAANEPFRPPAGLFRDGTVETGTPSDTNTDTGTGTDPTYEQVPHSQTPLPHPVADPPVAPPQIPLPGPPPLGDDGRRPEAEGDDDRTSPGTHPPRTEPSSSRIPPPPILAPAERDTGTGGG